MFGALVVMGDWSLVSCGVELVMVPGVSTSTVVMLHLCSARIRGDVTRWNDVAGTFVYLNTIDQSRRWCIVVGVVGGSPPGRQPARHKWRSPRAVNKQVAGRQAEHVWVAPSPAFQLSCAQRSSPTSQKLLSTHNHDDRNGSNN